MSGAPRRLALIATYDERPNVAELVDALLALPLALDVRIVDDASPDGTAERVRDRYGEEPRVQLVVRAGRLGYGSAMREGLLAAIEAGYDTVVTLDADLSHDPAALPELVRAAETAGGLAIGSRYAGGTRVPDWELWRRTLSRGANAYVRAWLGLGVRDCTSGFRAYARAALLAADPASARSRGYAFLVELLSSALGARTPWIEVPIVYRDRRVGRSKMSAAVIVEAIWAPPRLRLARLFSPRGARR